MRSSFIAMVLLSTATLVGNAQINILVNRGSFATVQQASAAEDKVDFYDADLTDDRACTESFAAMELATFLPKATRNIAAEINFPDHKLLPANGNVFIIGSRHSNSLIAKHLLPSGIHLENEQSYSIRSFKGNGRVVTIIEGADRIGTLYGVYRYLQEVGLRFMGLGEKGTILSHSPAELPAGLNISENPSYLLRGFYVWGDRKPNSDFFLWMARNKLNYWTAENQPVKLLKKLGVKLGDGGHRIQGRIFASDDEYTYNHPIFKGDENKPDDPYMAGKEYLGDMNSDGKLSLFEAHPEWYGMGTDGKRTKISKSLDAGQGGTNLCISNEDGRREFTKRIAQQVVDGQWRDADVFEFWLFDGGTWCACDRCKAVGSFTDKMFMIIYDLMKELEKHRISGRLHRRVEVNTNAYGKTLEPPTKPLPADFDFANSSITYPPIGRCYVHTFADPACTELNQKWLRAYQSWVTGEPRHYKSGSMLISEYYNKGAFKTQPTVYTRIMAADIPWYYHNGAREFYYMHTPDAMWGTWTLNQYLLGQLLWDVDADAKDIVDDYFNLYYPTTSHTTRNFYGQLELATASAGPLKSALPDDKKFTFSSLSNIALERDHMHYDKYQPLLNDGPDVVEMMDAMELAKKYLEQSLLDCKDLMEQQRLLEDKIRFDYGYATYRYIFHMLRTSLFHQRGDRMMAGLEFAVVERYAEQLKNMIEVVQVASEHANSSNALAASRSVKTFEEFRKLYGK